MTNTSRFIRLLGHTVEGGLLWCDIKGCHPQSGDFTPPLGVWIKASFADVTHVLYWELQSIDVVEPCQLDGQLHCWSVRATSLIPRQHVSLHLVLFMQPTWYVMHQGGYIPIL